MAKIACRCILIEDGSLLSYKVKEKNMVTLQSIVLPWSGEMAREVVGFRDEVVRCCGSEARFLPHSMRLLVFPDADPANIEQMVAEISDFLASIELPTRRARREQFVSLGYFGSAELDHLLTPDNPQSWIIHLTEQGGLVVAPGSLDDYSAKWGLVPCTSMTNHAVAWRRRGSDFDTMLVTDRKKGGAWDYSSDIGHESAHAAFAPVPLFSQMVNIGARAMPIASSDPYDLAPNEWARFAYVLCELAVVSVRGEVRDTQTGLPTIETWQETEIFLSLAHTLMPRFGFNHALQMLRYRGEDAMYALGAAVLKVAPALVSITNRGTPVEADWYLNVRV